MMRKLLLRERRKIISRGTTRLYVTAPQEAAPDNPSVVALTVNGEQISDIHYLSLLEIVDIGQGGEEECIYITCIPIY